MRILRAQVMPRGLMKVALSSLIGLTRHQPRLKYFAIAVSACFGMPGKPRQLYRGSKAAATGVHYKFPITQYYVHLGPCALFRGLKEVFKSAVHSLSRHVILFLSARPRLKKSALGLLRTNPRLEQKLRRYAFTIWNRLNQDPLQVIEETNLSARARQILSGLKMAIEKHNKVVS